MKLEVILPKSIRRLFPASAVEIKEPDRVIHCSPNKKTILRREPLIKVLKPSETLIHALL